MPTVLGSVEDNMRTAEKYIQKAAKKGAKFIVFPEFFTIGFDLSPKMISAILDSYKIQDTISSLSAKYQIAIGGSYLHYDNEVGDVLNTYGLFFPSGESFKHSKDIPTGLESFCYAAGDQISAFDTPLGRIGIVMCWEQLRWQTIARMKGKVDLIVGGSCWWNFAPEHGIAYSLYDMNRKLAEEAPRKVSEIMGVPVLHASHKAEFVSGGLTDTKKTCKRKIEGFSEAFDANGKKISRLMTESGYQIIDVETTCTKEVVVPKNKIWIPDLIPAFEQGFYKLNEQYSKYYKEKIKPYFQF